MCITYVWNICIHVVHWEPLEQIWQKCILIFCVTPDWSYRYEEYKYWPTLVLHANYTKRYFMYSLIHAQCQENAKYAQHTLIKQSTSWEAELIKEQAILKLFTLRVIIVSQNMNKSPKIHFAPKILIQNHELRFGAYLSCISYNLLQKIRKNTENRISHISRHLLCVK